MRRQPVRQTAARLAGAVIEQAFFRQSCGAHGGLPLFLVVFRRGGAEAVDIDQPHARKVCRARVDVGRDGEVDEKVGLSVRKRRFQPIQPQNEVRRRGAADDAVRLPQAGVALGVRDGEHPFRLSGKVVRARRRRDQNARREQVFEHRAADLARSADHQHLLRPESKDGVCRQRRHRAGEGGDARLRAHPLAAGQRRLKGGVQPRRGAPQTRKFV